jgi:hypothetical protein
MPTYTYIRCSGDPEELEERNVSISERDNQFCYRCGNKLQRKITFNGAVWAPTAGGMR